ncbi:MAG TPA: DUF2812 domain-containing protein [Lactobacillus sp.]|nr:DUF2812 domain-containing protein [Lactobacillus sp.]
MRKYRCFLSMDAEEKWINTIQEDGYRLIGVNNVLHCYTFKKLMDDKDFNPYTRLDFRYKSMGLKKYRDYQQLFLDSGWTLIKGSRWGGVQYFQQKNPNVGEEIFSDERSKAMSRKRSQSFALLYGTIFLMYSIEFKLIPMAGSNIFDFKSWYLTPGLWSMGGTHFWKAFLIETPFVIFRGSLFCIVLTMTIYYLLRACYSYTDKKIYD